MVWALMESHNEEDRVKESSSKVALTIKKEDKDFKKPNRRVG